NQMTSMPAISPEEVTDPLSQEANYNIKLIHNSPPIIEEGPPPTPKPLSKMSIAYDEPKQQEKVNRMTSMPAISPKEVTDPLSQVANYNSKLIPNYIPITEDCPPPTPKPVSKIIMAYNRPKQPKKVNRRTIMPAISPKEVTNPEIQEANYNIKLIPNSPPIIEAGPPPIPKPVS
ncbi:unnamed protein product, partial [Meganyctiphanes norvegica]